LNLVELWNLPVLFLCENNLYAMGTALERSESETSIAAKARSYRVPAEVVDGMDVVAIEAATRHAASAVREGNGPRLLEILTYRYRAHSMADPDLYRAKDEIERWKDRDPIKLYEERLRAAHTLHDRDVEAIENRVAQMIEDAVAEAEAGAWEPLEDIERFVVTE
jgi:TPP-dependent pyruvate/acetoin dehydrogenase alpha subunit